MTKTPCNACGTAYPGRVNYVYVGLMSDGDTARHRLSFCRPHLNELVTEARDFMTDWPLLPGVDSDFWFKCALNGGDLEDDGGCVLWLTYYLDRDAMTTLCAPLCDAHKGNASQRLRLGL